MFLAAILAVVLGLLTVFLTGFPLVPPAMVRILRLVLLCCVCAACRLVSLCCDNPQA